MVKLLIIADDFTGALDTGVQFAASGAETRVVTNRDAVFEDVEPGVQVLVLDAETRHLPAREAYDVVFSVTRRACRSKIPYIYKKTDSALRGNVESELKAVLEGTKQPVLHFFPASQNESHYPGRSSLHRRRSGGRERFWERSF